MYDSKTSVGWIQFSDLKRKIRIRVYPMRISVSPVSKLKNMVRLEWNMGRWAELVTQRTVNPWPYGILGSSPRRPTIWGHSSVGRAHPLQGWGREFDSLWLHHLVASLLVLTQPLINYDIKLIIFRVHNGRSSGLVVSASRDGNYP